MPEGDNIEDIGPEDPDESDEEDCAQPSDIFRSKQEDLGDTYER